MRASRPVGVSLPFGPIVSDLDPHLAGDGEHDQAECSAATSREVSGQRFVHPVEVQPLMMVHSDLPVRAFRPESLRATSPIATQGL